MVIEIGLGEWTRHPQLVIAHHRRGGQLIHGDLGLHLVKQGIEPLVRIPVTAEEADLWTLAIPDNRYRVVEGRTGEGGGGSGATKTKPAGRRSRRAS